MKIALIKWLYQGLDDWSKWEIHKELKCPSLDEVMMEQERQAARLFNRSKGGES